MSDEKSRPEYLGDGVYATFDGYQVWVTAERDGRQHSVALEPRVMVQLIRCAERAGIIGFRDKEAAT